MISIAVELLADIVLRNSLNDTEVDRAKNAVFNELQVSILTFILVRSVHDVVSFVL